MKITWNNERFTEIYQMTIKDLFLSWQKMPAEN